MPTLDPSQLDMAFQSSQSGRGFRLEGIEQLKAFWAYARTREAVVCNVETFELCGEEEVSRYDLSIFQGDLEHQALPMPERVTLADERMRQVLADIESEGIDCVFQVWADELPRE